MKLIKLFISLVYISLIDLNKFLGRVFGIWNGLVICMFIVNLLFKDFILILIKNWINLEK